MNEFTKFAFPCYYSCCIHNAPPPSKKYSLIFFTIYLVLNIATKEIFNLTTLLEYILISGSYIDMIPIVFVKNITGIMHKPSPIRRVWTKETLRDF